jgi:hypothetical protein
MSALGAGLGGVVETGDLEKGLLTGLGAFAGGQLLGPMFGGGAGALESTLPGQISTGPLASGQTALAAGSPGIAGQPIASLMPPAAPAGIKGLMGSAMDFAKSPIGLGSAAGAMAGSAAADALFKDDEEPKKKYGGEPRPIPRIPTMPGSGYNAGRDGEFNYGISTPYSAEQIRQYNATGVMPYANGGMLARMARPNLPGMGPVRLAGGGIVALAEGGDPGAQGPNERQIISAAVSAVRGEHPRPEIALAQFVQTYGENALRDLVDKVQSGQMGETAERFARGEKGEVRGPGDGSGVDDMVPAQMEDGSGDVLLSDGEFVLRKAATDALEKKFGGGFLDSVNKAGPKAADVAQRRMAAA